MDGPKRLTNEAFMAASDFYVYNDSHSAPIKLHCHEFYEMSFIASGTGIHILNGELFRLSRGSLFLLNPADFHEIIPDPHDPLHALHSRWV